MKNTCDHFNAPLDDSRYLTHVCLYTYILYIYVYVDVWIVRVSSQFCESTINSIYLLIYFIILSFGHTFDLRFIHKIANSIFL